MVLYPCDAVSTERLVERAAEHRGIVYIRTTRMDTPILYAGNEEFVIGGSKVLRMSGKDRVTIVAAGVTVFEALAAFETLKKEGILLRVIDLYSIKPLDLDTLKQAAQATKAIITVEDHYAQGGLGEAVRGALSQGRRLCISLPYGRCPQAAHRRSCLIMRGFRRDSIIRKVKEIL